MPGDSPGTAQGTSVSPGEGASLSQPTRSLPANENDALPPTTGTKAVLRNSKVLCSRQRKTKRFARSVGTAPLIFTLPLRPLAPGLFVLCNVRVALPTAESAHGGLGAGLSLHVGLNTKVVVILSAACADI